MFAPSVWEILAIGLPLIGFAGFGHGKPIEVQFTLALWGAWFGAVIYFMVLKLEYLNPYKFILLFILLPGFMLGMSYFSYRKPAELKPIAPQLEMIDRDVIKEGSPLYDETMGRKKELLLGLAKDCAWIWLVGGLLSGFIIAPYYGKLIARFDYAYQDTKRRRGLLGKKPTEPRARDLPPRMGMEPEERMSIRSDLPLEPRIDSVTNREGVLIGADNDDKNYWSS